MTQLGGADFDFDAPPMRPMNDDSPEVRTVDYGAALQVEDMPIDLIGPTRVELPGGLIDMTSGAVHTYATVRELNGFHEEELAKTTFKRHSDHLQKIVELGLVNIGGEPVNPAMLGSLLLGDRDAIVLGIRRATFGDVINFTDMRCPRCDKDFDVDVDIDTDFTVDTLDDRVNDRRFEVPLLHGGTAAVRLATVADGLASTSLAVSEQNTTLLARTVLTINGSQLSEMQQPPEATVRSMNMRDRALILDELLKRQPGPRFNDIEIDCPGGCGFKDVLVVTLPDLFRI